MFRHFLLKIIFYSFAFCLSQSVISQTIVLDTIIVSGNKRTQLETIYREGSLRPGDILAKRSLNESFENAKQQLLGTGLFNSLEIDPVYSLDSTTVILNYTCVENWYLFPVPILELADRNFNVWWQEFNGSPDRLIYGFRVAHYNLTGRRDKMKVVLHTGYTRKAELTYDLPNIFGNGDWGLGANLFYSDRREIGYITENNKPLFYKDEDERVLLKRFRAGAKLLHRPNTFLDQVFRVEFHQNTIDDIVANTLNPDYFLNSKTQLKFFFFEYDLQYDRTDYRLYPRDGYKLRFNVKKEGMFLFNQIDNTFLEGNVSLFRKFWSRCSVGSRWKARTNLSKQIMPYSNNSGLGWGSFIVTGYDLYVMDGPDYIISKNHFNVSVFETTIKLFDWLPKQIRSVPVQVFVRMNYDFAYVNEPTYSETNSLNNTWFYGYGPALDFILFNNYFFSMEYGITQQGERGYYFNSSIAF